MYFLTGGGGRKPNLVTINKLGLNSSGGSRQCPRYFVRRILACANPVVTSASTRPSQYSVARERIA
jgi:hypothetical protein